MGTGSLHRAVKFARWQHPVVRCGGALLHIAPAATCQGWRSYVIVHAINHSVCEQVTHERINRHQPNMEGMETG